MALYCYLKKTKDKFDLENYLSTMYPEENLRIKSLPITASILTDTRKIKKKQLRIFINKKSTQSTFTRLKSKIRPLSSPQKRSRFSVVLPFLLIACGISLLGVVFYPLVNWQIFQPENAPENSIIKPFSANSGESHVLAVNNSNEEKLYSANNWFPQSGNTIKGTNKIKSYTISIPKLNIENAKVIYGADDLTKSLIGFHGTAVPGEYGNAVVFGHSVLPEFYNPKDYHTIFATLPELKAGDEIFAEVDGVKYKYVAYDFKTVDPSEISVLEQKYDNYYLSLITCVPPGLKWKRLVVKAKLEPI